MKKQAKEETVYSSADIERPILWKNFIGYLVNLVISYLLTVILYFSLATPILNSNASYLKANQYVNGVNETALVGSINSEDYQDYQKAVYRFYFELYPEEITSFFNQQNNSNWSIERIYNVNVLLLPTDPSPINMSTDYFTYLSNEDGSVNVDAVGMMKTNLNERGLEDVRDIYKSVYNHFVDRLTSIDSEYAKDLVFVNQAEAISRISAFSFSLLVFFIIIPWVGKDGVGIGERVFGTAYCDKKGYKIKNYKLIFRTLCIMPASLLGLYFLNKYTVVILLIFVPFAECLTTIFTKDNVIFLDKLFSFICIDRKKSIIYENEEEKKERSQFELASYDDDREYVDTLSRASSLSPSEEENKEGE